MRNISPKNSKTPWDKRFVLVLVLVVTQSIWLSTRMVGCSIVPDLTLADAPIRHGVQRPQTSESVLQEELARQNQRAQELEAQLLAMAQKSNNVTTQNSAESGLQEELVQQTNRVQELEALLSTIAHPYKDETMRPYDPSRYADKRLAVDNEDEEARCKRYGYAYNPRVRDKKNPRRVFVGALIANDPMDLLEAQATENYGIFHSVVFIESNVTLSGVPRETRYHPGSPRLATLQNGFFGPDTKVHVKQFVEDNDTVKIVGMDREWLQRDFIVDVWIEDGMRPDDIGISGDADEMFSRDFMRALQICDIPNFRPGQDCSRPKILGAGLVFEGSPECITQGKRLWKPDIILGECIDGVGDPTGRPVAVRKLPMNRGRRDQAWRDNTTKDQKLFPLWSPCEIRILHGGNQRFMEGKNATYRGIPTKKTHRATAYHIHNFFPNVATLRHKYLTYGHEDPKAMTAALVDFGNDMKAFYKCIKGIEPSPEDKYKSTPGGFKVYADKGPMPLYFDEEYVEWKHKRAQQIVAEDDKRMKSGR